MAVFPSNVTENSLAPQCERLGHLQGGG